MNILITSAGRRSYLISYFKEALNGKGLVHACNSEYSLALKEADEYFISSLIYDNYYIDEIINYCKKNYIKAIISLFDIDLLVLSNSKERIESEGIKLLLSNSDIVRVCNDKWESYQFFCRNGFLTPNTYKDLLSVKKALENKEVSFPLIIKPRWGMASMSIYSVDNFAELEVLYSKVENEILNSHLKYETNFTPNEGVLIQEKINGIEYGVDIINDLNGEFVASFAKTKLRMRAGETDLGETVKDDALSNISRELSEKFKHELILSLDCFNCNGNIFLLEMNCRISGHYPLSHLAGVNLPKQIIEWLDGGNTNYDNFNFEEGLLITKDLVPTILKYRINSKKP